MFCAAVIVFYFPKNFSDWLAVSVVKQFLAICISKFKRKSEFAFQVSATIFAQS